MKRGRDKKAQIFILAAIILSVLLISFGFIYNSVRVSNQPKNFNDVSYNVKKESGGVVDYEIYNNISDKISLSNFVNSLAEYIIDKNPDSNFLFIYGNSGNLTLWNYGVNDASYNADGKSGDIIGGGRHVVSSVSYVPSGSKTRVSVNVNETISSYTKKGWTKTLGGLNDTYPIAINVSGKDYYFQITRENQVITIIQKAVANESYTSVK